jgi:hypothetical protein
MEETQRRPNLSAAARRELLDRTRDIHEPPNEHYGRGYGSGVWFGHGDNAATRELEAAGLVDRVQFGWSEERTITRDGYELAEALHAEKRRLEAGIPFAEWKPTGGIKLYRGPWTCVELPDGRHIHSDGVSVAFGKVEHTEEDQRGWYSSRSRPTQDRLRQDWDRAMPKARGLERVRPIAWQAFGRNAESGMVWFSNGQAINEVYYKHFTKLYPNGRWMAQPNANTQCPVSLMVDGAVVAAVMPMRDSLVPAIVQAVAA